MSLKLLFVILALALLGTGSLAGAGSGADYALSGRSTQAAAVPRPELDIWSAKPSLGVKATTDVDLYVPANAREVEKMTLYVPSGYGIAPTAPPGTREGHVFLQTASDVGFGDLKAADPAAYVNTPQAQACAPGSHIAVWTMQFDAGFFSSQTLTIPVYIDPTSGDETTLGAYKLQSCLPLAKAASPGGWPLGSRLRDLGLEFTRLTNPTSTALYVWRAYASNPDTTGNPDPTTTYELRADMPLPAKVSLSGRLDRKHRRVVLSGRLTAPAASIAGIPVGLYRRPSCDCWKYLAESRTANDGSYRFVRPIKRTTRYSTEVWGIRDCQGVSTAPNGCLSETFAAIDSPIVRIVVRRHR